MSEASAAVPAAEAAISPVAAVVGTFSRPSETFRRLVARPTWWLPFVLVVIATIASWAVVAPKLDMDRTVRESIEKRAEKSGRTIPPEVVDRQVQMSKKLMPVFFAAGVVGGAAVFFLGALVLWGSAKAMGAEARYPQLLAIWGHAGLPSVLGALLAIPDLPAASGCLVDAGRRSAGRQVERGRLPGSFGRRPRCARSPARSTCFPSPCCFFSSSASAACRAFRRAQRRRYRSSCGSSW